MLVSPEALPPGHCRPTGSDMSIILSQAYAILSDPNARRAYDKEARVVAQWVDSQYKIQDAINSCPVNCISRFFYGIAVNEKSKSATFIPTGHVKKSHRRRSSLTPIP
ncbi:hypothetical protein PIB30_088313, partial [Stylosanthes scabra]|nr:hypothetical protein [Stylosanthes scabra]